MRSKIYALLASLSVAFPIGTAFAATCQVSPQSVSFGSYDPLSASPLDGVGNISVSCDAQTPITISLSAGSGDFAQRKLSGGTSTLEYNLFIDSSRTTVWGDGSGGSSVLSLNVTLSDVAVYGRIPPNQNVISATYSDSITVTITY